MPKLFFKKYHDSADFAADESFQNFCLHKNAAVKLKWYLYRLIHPSQREIMDEAKYMVMLFYPHIGNEIKISKRINFVYKVAAIFTLSIALGFMYKAFNNHSAVSYATTTKKALDGNVSLMMSDETNVDLRNGSSLSFTNELYQRGKREVTLTGEAYFDVKKSKGEFSVLLHNGAIKVLGTKFLVATDSMNTKIILEEGKINYDVNGKTYELIPGDILLSNKDMVSIHHNTNSRDYDLWRNPKLVFTNIAIADVVEQLNNSYNLNIHIGNNKLQHRRITATVNQNNPRLLLEAISEIYSIKIIEKPGIIILK